VNWPYRILARTGKVLGKFDHLADALAAYDRWEQSAAIVIGCYVVCKKGGR
jgi:hypothetical protein